MLVTRAHRLPNGLGVLIREVHTAPIATAWLWFRVGSRNDPPGAAGLSHLVEHLLFQTTVHQGSRSLKRLVARAGGTANGLTATDYSTCYATLPAAQIAIALGLLADTMQHSQFDSAAIERERAIIMAEQDHAADSQVSWLREAVLTTAFRVHPYRHRVIGTAGDLAAITYQDVARHYQMYYTPTNAMLVLVGAFDTDAVLHQVEQVFTDLAPGGGPATLQLTEPRQQRERRVTIARPGPTDAVQIVYHAPSCRHPDFAALLLLDAVLSGAKPVSFSHGAVTHQSARLTSALVATGLASTACSHYYATYDPRLFELHAMVAHGERLGVVESALIDTIERIQQEGITPVELARARKQIQAQLAYAREGIRSQAWLLGMWAMLDQFTRADTLGEAIDTMTTADIQQVAQTYLTTSNRIIGHLLAVDR